MTRPSWDETAADRRARTGETHDRLRRKCRLTPGTCQGDIRKVGLTRRRHDVGECLACGAILVADWRAGTLEEFARINPGARPRRDGEAVDAANQCSDVPSSRS